MIGFDLGLPGWFRHAYFEYHAHVRLRFRLASGLGQAWTRDGGIPQGCPLSMMFIVALYLPWCRYLAPARTSSSVCWSHREDSHACSSCTSSLVDFAACFCCPVCHCWSLPRVRDLLGYGWSLPRDWNLLEYS